MKTIFIFMSLVYCLSGWAQAQKISITHFNAFEHRLQPLLKAHNNYLAGLNNQQWSAVEKQQLHIIYEQNRNRIIQLKIDFITQHNSSVEALKIYAGLYYWLDFATRKRVFHLLHPTLHQHPIAMELAALLQ